MKRARIRAAVLTAALIAQGAMIVPASADEHLRVEVVADGLDNPRGIDADSDGTLYVAEAGAGGDDHCITLGEGEDASQMCMGETARVTAIADGEASAFVSDLPSMMAGEGEFVGASDVVVGDDGELYVAMGLGGDAEMRDGVVADWEPAQDLGTILHVEDGIVTQLADLAQWEADNDPNAGQPSTTEGPEPAPSNDSNPNGLLLTEDGRLLAVDAGGNTVLDVDRATGEIELEALFEDRMAEAPPFIGLPPGTQIPMQAVPTNLDENAEGEIVVGELTGFPFPVGGAMVQRLTGTDTPEPYEEGFTNIMDVAFVDGELYVLELAHDSLLGGMQGALVRVREDGTRIALLQDVLVAPGGLATHDGMIYITNQSVGAPGTGSVIRFDPSMSADPATQSACPPLSVPGTALSDVTDSLHEEAITCVSWHGLFTGFADGTFGPASDITRGQFATTVANLVEATGTDLAAGDTGVFDDVDGTTHDEAINALAEAGLVNGYGDDTYRPNTTLSRQQAVSILVAAYEHVTGEPLADGPDAFDDDDAPHEANINAAASMGWILGTGDRMFSPEANIRRGQMASALARIASDLVDEEYLTLPS